MRVMQLVKCISTMSVMLSTTLFAQYIPPDLYEEPYKETIGFLH